MKWKKALALLLTGVMVAGLAACTKPAPANTDQPPKAGIFVPGTYAGTAAGMNGDVAVSVTFDSAKITAVTVGEHKETPGISDPAIADIPQAILAAQSTQVDGVSGATITSNAIIGAVNAAIVLAGADPAALKPIAAPEKPAPTATTMETDVIVVGGGLTGVSAAIKARQAGARVVLIEKLGALGGASALSGGTIGAVNSSVQKDFGITDSVENWLSVWKERQVPSLVKGESPDWVVVERLIGNSGATIDWMRELGFVFREPEGAGHDPVKRVHSGTTTGAGGGAAMMAFMGGKAAELGAEILVNTRATELIEVGGAIVGVKAEGKNGPVIINGKSVVLACGGFARSVELTKRFAPEVVDFVDYSSSSIGNTGDGILMAEAVGAALYEDPWGMGMGLTSPISDLIGLSWYGNYIYVNTQGKRFTNEGGHYAVVYNDSAYKATDGTFMIFDSNESHATFIAAAEGALGGDFVFKADTIEALAAAIGVSVANLKAETDAYGKGEDAFGKPAKRCVPITEGPFYAARVYPCSSGTFGGVKVNEQQEVLDTAGKTIPGLYAGGETANRPYYYAQGYLPSCALQVAATSGRFAGEAAAMNAKK